jgi:hypothetical protein
VKVYDKEALVKQLSHESVGTVNTTTTDTTIDRDQAGRIDHIKQVRKVVRLHHIGQALINWVTVGSALLYVYDFTVFSHHIL